MSRSGFDYSADHGFGMDIQTGPNEARYTAEFTEGHAEAEPQGYSAPSPECYDPTDEDFAETEQHFRSQEPTE